MPTSQVDTVIYVLIVIATIVPIGMAVLAYFIINVHTTVKEVRTIAEETKGEVNHRLDEFRALLRAKSAKDLESKLAGVKEEGIAEGKATEIAAEQNRREERERQ